MFSFLCYTQYMKYDVCVIGGGPAGLMAAGQASELGARVIVIEKNPKVGAKLLITGKGRCNLTHNSDNVRDLVKEFGDNGKFLFSCFNAFGVKETISFFEDLGVKTKVERGDRVFPVSDRSMDVLKALVAVLKKNRVEIKVNSVVDKIIKQDDLIEKVVLKNKSEIVADKYILCTGGKSYPGTGSTGDGYTWLKKLGHEITPLRPGLVPVIVKESWIKELEGLSLKNVEISLYLKDKKVDSRFGEALFTDNGLSGPIVLDLSKKIGELLPKDLKLRIDFKPALDVKALDLRLQRDFQKFQNKLFRNSLDELLPKKLIPVFIKLSEIDPNIKVNRISKENRKTLLRLLKEFTLSVKSLDSYAKAIITCGGVKLAEVDPKTMQSKLIPNLYLAGEILDVDGPTGGYNLQVCWSTGYVAGQSI